MKMKQFGRGDRASLPLPLESANVCVAGTSFIAFHFTAMTKTNKFNDGDFQQVCTSVGTLQNNHENIHFRFRTLTMQMCCRIVDLNYLTL